MKKSKQIKNRKDVLQNNRNRLINRRYLILVKKFSKEYKTLLLELSKVQNQSPEKDIFNQPFFLEKKKQAGILLQKLTSLYDKSVKKNIYHKNTSARKKSRFQKLYNQILFSV